MVNLCFFFYSLTLDQCRVSGCSWVVKCESELLLLFPGNRLLMIEPETSLLDPNSCTASRWFPPPPFLSTNQKIKPKSHCSRNSRRGREVGNKEDQFNIKSNTSSNGYDPPNSSVKFTPSVPTNPPETLWLDRHIQRERERECVSFTSKSSINHMLTQNPCSCL